MADEQPARVRGDCAHEPPGLHAPGRLRLARTRLNALLQIDEVAKSADTVGFELTCALAPLKRRLGVKSQAPCDLVTLGDAIGPLMPQKDPLPATVRVLMGP